jgi:hypothetical protein
LETRKPGRKHEDRKVRTGGDPENVGTHREVNLETRKPGRKRYRNEIGDETGLSNQEARK